MTGILFLAHRIPYPPDKGDKIRSWHLLDGLARRCTVHLGTFIDDPSDRVHVQALEAVCGEVCVRPLPRTAALARGLRGFVTGEPLTTGYYRDRELHRWVRSLAARRPLAAVFVFSSSMAQYATGLPLAAGAARVIDLCDVDSDKWRQYAASHAPPMRWLYAREARLLASVERHAAADFDATLVVADAEASLLRAIAPGSDARVRVVPNGVDAAYFDPAGERPNPYPAGSRPVVFVGAMDYYANVDAVRWFADAVLPAIRTAAPDALFAVVGSRPAPEVTALARPGMVLVTGRVPDVRPYLAHAAAVVAPLRIARGVQNKVLEAMAMARPLVATSNAVQGIAGAAQAGVVVADDAASIARAVVQVLERPRGALPALRRHVEENFAWRARIDAVTALLLGAPAPEHEVADGRLVV